jgi:hypothetical protein
VGVPARFERERKVISDQETKKSGPARLELSADKESNAQLGTAVRPQPGLLTSFDSSEVQVPQPLVMLRRSDGDRRRTLTCKIVHDLSVEIFRGANSAPLKMTGFCAVWITSKLQLTRKSSQVSHRHSQGENRGGLGAAVVWPWTKKTAIKCEDVSPSSSRDGVKSS